MILGLLTAAGSVLTSGVIIEAVTSGVGLGLCGFKRSAAGGKERE